MGGRRSKVWELKKIPKDKSQSSDDRRDNEATDGLMTEEWLLIKIVDQPDGLALNPIKRRKRNR